MCIWLVSNLNSNWKPMRQFRLGKPNTSHKILLSCTHRQLYIFCCAAGHHPDYLYPSQWYSMGRIARFNRTRAQTHGTKCTRRARPAHRDRPPRRLIPIHPHCGLVPAASDNAQSHYRFPSCALLIPSDQPQPARSSSAIVSDCARKK